jgi:hypothetical protein
MTENFRTLLVTQRRLCTYLAMSTLLLFSFLLPPHSFSQSIEIQQKSVPESLKSVDCPNFSQLVTNFQEKVRKIKCAVGLKKI